MSSSTTPTSPKMVSESTGEVLETDAIRLTGLAELRSRMAKHVRETPTFRYPREDDQFLLPFLRVAKYKIEKAFTRINNFAKFWYSHRDMINGLCAAKVREVYATGNMQLLSTKDVLGNPITALRMGKFNPTVATPRAMMELSTYCLAMVFEKDDLQLHGACYVETFEGFSLSESIKLSGSMNSKEQTEMMSLATDTFPMRVRDIWVINTPWYFSMFWKMVRPFLKAKLTKRVHVLGKTYAEALHAAVPKEHLPSDFGGTLDEPQSQFLDIMERMEKEDGMIGGFALPLDVDDPTGVIRRGNKSAAETMNNGIHISMDPSSSSVTIVGAGSGSAGRV